MIERVRPNGGEAAKEPPRANRALKHRTDYDVGYGKPPKASQFKNGESGNKSGRPRGARNFRTLLTEALLREVTFKENGRTRRMSKMELGCERLADQFAKGNPRVVTMLQKTVLMQDKEPETRPSDLLDEVDQEVARGMVDRHQNPASEADGDG